MKVTMERGRDGEYGVYRIEGREDLGPVYIRDEEAETWLARAREFPEPVELGNRHGLESSEVRAIASAYGEWSERTLESARTSIVSVLVGLDGRRRQAVVESLPALVQLYASVRQ